LIHGKPIWEQEALSHPTITMVNSLVSDAADLKCDELALINFTIISRIFMHCAAFFQLIERLPNRCFEVGDRKSGEKDCVTVRRSSMGAKPGCYSQVNMSVGITNKNVR